jgi:hypothetical protein
MGAASSRAVRVQKNPSAASAAKVRSPKNSVIPTAAGAPATLYQTRELTCDSRRPSLLTMSFLATIKAKVGNEVYQRIEKEAEKEVALAMQMPLIGENYEKNYYRQRFSFDQTPPSDLLTSFESFENARLKVSPTDLIKILFNCKLLFASKTEQEFGQRRGGLFPILEDPALIVRWQEKAESIDVLIDRHVDQLAAAIRPRTLLAPLSSLTSIQGDTGQQAFFDGLFTGLGLPFVCFLEGDHLIEKHKQLDPLFPSYDRSRAEDFFSAPSIGFTSSGSRDYCFWYSVMWLRTFLNLLRICSYVNPGQVDFGMWDVKMIAPTFPVFLGERSKGFLKWDEDKREPWAKIPDGCLFLSFGYRGLSKAWFDLRTFPRIEKFMHNHKKIFERLKNPWDTKSTRDIAPILDILSSATQIPDVGAKILLIYCCLEHLFVPKNAKSDNRKYIIGGMNALAPELLSWFDRLYYLRCDYAHKGFVLRDDTTMSLIMDSMRNAMTLLIAKLTIS